MTTNQGFLVDTSSIHFLDAPKATLTFLSFESVSLSSPFIFVVFFKPAPDAEVGVALFEVASLRKEVLIGVGACEGVVCEEESPDES
jgi:hypothetical protein